MLNGFSHVRLFATLWTIACQAPLSMGFSKQKYGVGCHALLQGLPDPGIQTESYLSVSCNTRWALYH